MDRKPLENLTATAKFDPSKNYGWDAEDKFTVTGAEIMEWQAAMAAFVNTPEYQRFTKIQRGALSMNAFIKDAAEQGLIREIKPQNNGSSEQVDE